jgi:hypothetical protein
MLDDKQKRIRVIVPNIMGHDADSLPATYPAFYDAASGASAPDDGRPPSMRVCAPTLCGRNPASLCSRFFGALGDRPHQHE